MSSRENAAPEAPAPEAPAPEAPAPEAPAPEAPAPEAPAPEAPWRRRFRAARVTLPAWHADAPERLTYSTNAGGVWQVVSWDLRSDRHTTVTDKPTGVRGGQPLPDGSGVVWFDDHNGDEVGRYVVTPFDGGPAAPLVTDLDEGWSAGISLRRGRSAVGVAGRDGFRIAVVDEDGTREVYRHAQPAGVGGLSRDGRLLAVSHTEHGDTIHPALRVVDAADGTVVGDLWDGPGNTLSPAAWSPVPGDPRLAVLADRSGRTRPELWDVTSGARTALDLDLPGEVWVAGWWPDAAALLLGHDHLGRTELHRYDVDTGRVGRVPVPDGAVDASGGTIRAARVRPDGAIWYAHDTAARPPAIRSLEANGGDRPLLVPPGPEAPAGQPYRSLHYDNGDGGRVHAFVAVPDPATAGPGPHPLVVDVHGGPQAQTEDSFDPFIQAWVDHGFAVLMPNYRGSTGYGKAWEDALVGDPGRPELVDVLAGRDHLVAEGVADPDRCVITGASWGGYLTLQGLGTQPEAWAAGVATVPVADYPTAYADEAPVLQEFDRSLFGGTPDDLPDLYRDRSPLTHVDLVRAPVLVITGRNDTRCPKRQVDNYIAALEARGIPHRYDVFDAGHGSYDVGETIRQQALALDFLTDHLGTPPAAD